MKVVIFGLSISSSWGNGHATLWRGLCKALARRGHQVEFFERDTPYYAAHRDLTELPGGGLNIYPNWEEVRPAARRALEDADVGMVTSYCPDGVTATELVLMSRARLRVFYDLDTPVTLERLNQGEPVAYLGPRLLRDFDLVLSFTGGRSLAALRGQLGARRVAPLYGSVDPEVHRPTAELPGHRSDLSYLGTWAADRQAALERLFIEPARRLPGQHFVIAGALYPPSFPWRANISYLPHLAPPDHPAFFCGSRLTLNVTRGAMACLGYCPSGRLFEAAACGTAVVSDRWEGLEQFFTPGQEILCAESTEDVMDALAWPRDRLRALARAARERVMAAHTAGHRALELEALLEEAARATPQEGAAVREVQAR